MDGFRVYQDLGCVGCVAVVAAEMQRLAALSRHSELYCTSGTEEFRWPPQIPFRTVRGLLNSMLI